MFKNKGLNALLKQRGHETPLKWVDLNGGFSERLNDMINNRVINFDYASLYLHPVYNIEANDDYPVYNIEANDDIRTIGEQMIRDFREQRRLYNLEDHEFNTDPINLPNISRII